MGKQGCPGTWHFFGGGCSRTCVSELPKYPGNGFKKKLKISSKGSKGWGLFSPAFPLPLSLFQGRISLLQVRRGVSPKGGQLNRDI